MALPNAYADVAQTSLISSGGTKPPEMYIPLWWYSGSYSTYTGATVIGSVNLQKGSTSGSKGYNVDSSTKLITLISSWPSTLNFALEATLYGGASQTVTAYLWDYTTNTTVSGSGLSTTATTATVIRSSQFTLVPGRTYGVTFNNTGGAAYITDASLIVFP